ncbi:MAG: hypothetical protein WKF77_14165 [Planctomycetaceae bacterium]
MFGNLRVPLASRTVFFFRLFRSLARSIVLIALSLSVGVAGYHWIAGLPWVDSLLNASMILGGMGPVNVLTTNASKIFAACYALFSGLVLVGATGLMLGPILHRILHKLHLDDLDEIQERNDQQSGSRTS